MGLIKAEAAAEAIGNLVSVVIPPDRKIESAEVLARINHGEVVAPFETVRLRKDGAQVDVSLTVSPVKDGDGHIIGASENARDIRRPQRAGPCRGGSMGVNISKPIQSRSEIGRLNRF
jgi:PAS domain S-box-containing protein